MYTRVVRTILITLATTRLSGRFPSDIYCMVSLVRGTEGLLISYQSPLVNPYNSVLCVGPELERFA